MSRLKRIYFFQSILSVLSIVAIVMSLLALLSVNSLRVKIDKADELKKRIKPINDIPDVEVVKIDGSVDKINATKSLDLINKLLKQENHKGNKKVNKSNNNGKENVSLNEQSKNIDNALDKSNNIEVKEDKLIVKSEDEKKSSDNGLVEKDVVLLKVSPVLREDKIKKSAVKNQGNKVVKKKVFGKFVVQASAFSNKLQAEKQCKKISAIDGSKKCAVKPSANKHFYRTIVYPFKTKDEASVFASKLSSKLNVNCFVKKNI